MPMTRWEFWIVPCMPSRNKCLCSMPQDAGHAFWRCAMTCAFEFACLRRIINVRLLLLLLLLLLLNTIGYDAIDPQMQ